MRSNNGLDIFILPSCKLVIRKSLTNQNENLKNDLTHSHEREM